MRRIKWRSPKFFEGDEPRTQPADIIITNARIFTSNPGQPWAEAVAVRCNHIIRVGIIADVHKWRGEQTKMINGGGHTLTPGFIDSHFHLLSGKLFMRPSEPLFQTA